MTAISAQFALNDVKPDMVLSDDLLDQQGQVLLPKGATLTEHIIESLHRHDVVSVRIAMGELTPEEDAIQRAHFQVRLERLFRKSDDEHANGLLHRYIRTFRLGEEA
ncbi:hypothetical protein [Herminiimonas fonticola]|uniref:Uncharacterized protein n=1 Tax=Herminiimonas fonticola TaxID=303380 RepID=A0A4R6G6V1_9BURK|nr:hypothetical protein [Herminiimonas fonticola]RBA23104.1 hypothetical protein Hfont_2907 [Herminiimonas fonticola]TDN89454.1 hypothetical protein EV677_1511 [Herminiimonas fonticola]